MPDFDKEVRSLRITEFLETLFERVKCARRWASAEPTNARNPLCRLREARGRRSDRPPSSAMNSRRLMSTSRASGPALSFDHLIGAAQQGERDGESECPSSIEVHHQPEHGRPLDWQIAGLGSFQDLVNVDRRSAVNGWIVGTERQ